MTERPKKAAHFMKPGTERPTRCTRCGFAGVESETTEDMFQRAGGAQVHTQQAIFVEEGEPIPEGFSPCTSDARHKLKEIGKDKQRSTRWPNGPR